MKRSAGLALALIGVLASAPGVGAERSAGCGAEPPTSPGTTLTGTLQQGDLSREYRLHLPPSYDPEVPMSLVLSVHGYTGSAELSELQWTGMSRHADANGYVVVYPQSTSFAAERGGRQGRITSWNDLACSLSTGPAGPTCAEDADRYPCPPECGQCGPCSWCSCHDDIGFIAALLDELETSLCLDRDRLSAVGFSNGGMFVHRLGCALGDRLRAVAPFAGTLARGFNCAAAERPTSLLLLTGTSDRTVPHDGSTSSDGYFYTSDANVARGWAEAQGCNETVTPIATPWDGLGDLTCLEHGGCTSGATVLRCTWRGQHDWPRVGAVDDPPAVHFGNELLWWFFQRSASADASRDAP